jgi:alpha-mannosidase
MSMKKGAAPRLSRRNWLKAAGAAVGAMFAGGVVTRGNAGLAVARATPAKRLYIAPDDHTDYMWQANEATSQQAFIEMLDYYLDLADATAGELPEYQSRWNCDGSFWIWVYERNRTAAQFQRLIERLRDGHISAPLNPLVVCLGGAPAEAVLRGMYYPGQLERQHKLRFVLASSIENQVLPYGLGALWAGAGAKYSWKGICGCASKVPDAFRRQHEIYWWQGPDDSRILTKWYSKTNGTQSLGGYAEAYDPDAIVEALDAKCLSGPRYDYAIAAAFGYGWDGMKALTDRFGTVAKQKSNSERQVIVSNQQDFFEDFEATYGDGLPAVSATFGNEWELYCASLAEVSARVKRAVEKCRSAEALATLVSLQDSTFMDGRQAVRDQAWMSLGLYFEHDWTADGGVSRNQRRNWQRGLAGDVETYVNGLHTDAANALGGMIRKEGEAVRFFAFNPLSWRRTDYADYPYSGATPVHVIDLTTGLETPSQMVTVDGERRLRVLAQEVPSVGYKVFEMRPGRGQDFGNAATVNNNVMEDARYRLTVGAGGAITSLVDKTRGNREFSRAVNGRRINDLGSTSGNLTTENAGPVSVTLAATSSQVLAHTSRITLVRDVNRIDVRNDITQNFGGIFTWAFGFNLEDPDVWHEEVGAFIRARLLAQGGHYAAECARYDWLTLNHFADVSGRGNVGVTLSNADCYFMRLGNSTSESLDTMTPQISPLAGGQVDGTTLGILSQGGDSHFMQRFALQTHDAFDPASAMRFSLEHQNPLVTGTVSGGKFYPETSFSLLTISDPHVLLWALKPAEDGMDKGVVARLWNFSAEPRRFALRPAIRWLADAMHLSHIETPIGPATVADGALQDRLAGQQLKTYALRLLGRTFLPLVS